MKINSGCYNLLMNNNITYSLLSFLKTKTFIQNITTLVQNLDIYLIFLRTFFKFKNFEEIIVIIFIPHSKFSFQEI